MNFNMRLRKKFTQSFTYACTTFAAVCYSTLLVAAPKASRNTQNTIESSSDKKSTIYYMNSNNSPREMQLISTTSANGFCLGGTSVEPIVGPFIAFRCFNLNGEGTSFDNILVDVPQSKRLLNFGSCARRTKFVNDSFGDLFTEDTAETYMLLPNPKQKLEPETVWLSAVMSRRLDRVDDKVTLEEIRFVQKAFDKYNKHLFAEYQERGCKSSIKQSTEMKRVPADVFVGAYNNEEITIQCIKVEATNYADMLVDFKKPVSLYGKSFDCDVTPQEMNSVTATCKNDITTFYLTGAHSTQQCEQMVKKYHSALQLEIKAKTAQEKAEIPAPHNKKDPKTENESKSVPTQK